MIDYYYIRLFFDFLAMGIKVVAFSVVIWGVLISIVKFFQLEWVKLMGKQNGMINERDDIRHILGSYLLFGFEILIVSDLIVTLLEPGMIELLSLVVIVLIRTLLSYFLNSELKASLERRRLELEVENS
jgi:uncharacterized membrane protein